MNWNCIFLIMIMISPFVAYELWVYPLQEDDEGKQ